MRIGLERVDGSGFLLSLCCSSGDSPMCADALTLILTTPANIILI
jgi:hypothetical protein